MLGPATCVVPSSAFVLTVDYYRANFFICIRPASNPKGKRMRPSHPSESDAMKDKDYRQVDISLFGRIERTKLQRAH